LPTYLAIAQLLVAVALIVTVLLQIRGGGLGGIFGQPDSVYRTRRGIEKTFLYLTIVLVVVFITLAISIAASAP